MRLAIELRDAGLELDDIWAEIAGWNQMVNIHYMLGEPAAALDRLDRMLARDPVSTPDPTVLRYGVSQRVCARSWGASAAWMIGYPGRAISLGEESVALAKQRPYAMDVCYAMAFLLGIHLELGQIDAVRAGAEEMRSLAEEHGIELFAGIAQMFAAVADAVRGRGDADPAATCLRGFERVSSGAKGNLSHAPGWMCRVADVLRRVGRLEEAEEWAAAALGIADSKEQRYWNAELHRTIGEIALARDEPDEAEARSRFEHALEIARSQQARSLELRAATSLARLLRDRGRRDEARALLAPVYAWFTEGFDTADLKDAKTLLEELGG